MLVQHRSDIPVSVLLSLGSNPLLPRPALPHNEDLPVLCCAGKVEIV